MKYNYICHSCDERIEVTPVHHGFDNSTHAYCTSCARVFIIDLYSPKVASVIQNNDKWQNDKTTLRRIEETIAPCVCGGRYSFDASLRCPNCLKEISIDHFSEAIDLHHKWWDKKWNGLYAFILNDVNSTDSSK